MDIYRAKPSLDDALARVSRANEHIASLEREIAAVLSPDRTIRLAASAGLGGGAQYISAPPILAILIGETLYNLRAALDYLVFELVYLDAGKPKSGTKFLIEDTVEGWDKHLPNFNMSGHERRKLWLDKLTAAHQAALKALQPCHGCEWTRRLRGLSNPDKHRRLLAV